MKKLIFSLLAILITGCAKQLPNSSSPLASEETISTVIVEEITSTEIVEEIIATETSEEVVDTTKRLLLIAGHGNADPGAVYLHRQEAVYNQYFVDNLKVRLNEIAPHIEVLLEPRLMNAKEEAELISQLKPDFALNVHFNAGKGVGSEIIVPFNDADLSFADSLLNELKENQFAIRPTSMFSKSSTSKVARKLNDTPSNQQDYYAVIRSGAKLQIPSYILEVEFIDNVQQMDIYDARSAEYIEITAQNLKKYLH